HQPPDPQRPPPIPYTTLFRSDVAGGAARDARARERDRERAREREEEADPGGDGHPRRVESLSTSSSRFFRAIATIRPRPTTTSEDRKSTRLNSSHQIISYAVF